MWVRSWIRKMPCSRKWQLQYSCLGKPMERGARRAVVHRVTKSWVSLSMHGTKAQRCPSDLPGVRSCQGVKPGFTPRSLAPGKVFCRCQAASPTRNYLSIQQTTLSVKCAKGVFSSNTLKGFIRSFHSKYHTVTHITQESICFLNDTNLQRTETNASLMDRLFPWEVASFPLDHTVYSTPTW